MGFPFNSGSHGMWDALQPKQKSEVLCPRCGCSSIYMDARYNGRSRLDGRTIICADCGIDEARHGTRRISWSNTEAEAQAVSHRAAMVLTGQWPNTGWGVD